MRKPKIYYFNSNTLEYKNLKLRYFILPIIVFIIFFSLIRTSDEEKLTNLPSYEEIPLIVNVKDTLNNFSEKKLISLLKELNVKFPHIVLAQSKLETGNYTSKIFKENNNLFGMKEARVRINTANGTQYNHAFYSNWRESVYDYAFYQCRYLGKVNTEMEYYNYLGQSYAEASNYVITLKRLVKKEKLKDFFE